MYIMIVDIVVLGLFSKPSCVVGDCDFLHCLHHDRCRWFFYIGSMSISMGIYNKNIQKKIPKYTYVVINKFIFISTRCCSYKPAVLHKPELPVGMCYRTFRKTNVLCEDKITSHLQNWRCMHLCYLIVMNAWSHLYYTYNYELIRYRPRHVTRHVISSFAHPLSLHSPLATFQNDSHSTTTSVSQGLCNGLPIYNHYVTKITSRNGDIISLPLLDLEEVWVDPQFLAPPPLLQWIWRPSWKRHSSQHVGAGFQSSR